MSIRISNTSIHFGNFTLTANTEGFSFDGKIRAKRGFVDSRVHYQGDSFGYISGGRTSPTTASNVIDKHPFPTDASASDVGDLSQTRASSSGSSSKTHGYNAGGDLVAPGAGWSNVVDKFPFAIDTNASDVGDLTTKTNNSGPSYSAENGYTHSGALDPPLVFTSNLIQKFPFATDTNASDVGDLTESKLNTGGVSSKTFGYSIGGQGPGTVTNSIEKYPFATDTNSKDVGDLSVERQSKPCGNSSEVNGYASGGYLPGTGVINSIEKFPFANDANGTDVGDLTESVSSSSGTNSRTHGYRTAGNLPGPTGLSNVIDKFPFALDTNATDVGDTTQSRAAPAGQQV